MICNVLYKVEDHQCGVIGCAKSRRKICHHVTVNCANCEGNYMVNSLHYSLRYKANVKVKKNGIDTDTPQPTLDMQIDCEKEKLAQELNENHDLIMEINNWAVSLASVVQSLYDEEKS